MLDCFQIPNYGLNDGMVKMYVEYPFKDFQRICSWPYYIIIYNDLFVIS